MSKRITKRALKHAKLIIKHHYTVRQVADITDWSKSTVFLDVTVRLQKINPKLYDKIQYIFSKQRDAIGYTMAKGRWGK